jgi:hypothetical protein
MNLGFAKHFPHRATIQSLLFEPLGCSCFIVTSPTDYEAPIGARYLVATRKSVIQESRLDQEATAAREELAKRKRARDLRRQEQGNQAEDVMRRFADKGSKAKALTRH